ELKLEDKVYITNLLKLRPPNNRNPKKEEIERHKQCLIRQIKTINPEIIITLGNFSTKFVLNNFNTKGMDKIPSISKLNGKIQKIRFGNKEIKVIPIYHPAAVLYNPSLKEEFDKAFEKVKGLLENEDRKVKNEL
ncbi:MAG: uracil-DNA glycosylase, partial [Nanoarchaeota archaeon]